MRAAGVGEVFGTVRTAAPALCPLRASASRVRSQGLESGFGARLLPLVSRVALARQPVRRGVARSRALADLAACGDGELTREGGEWADVPAAATARTSGESREVPSTARGNPVAVCVVRAGRVKGTSVSSLFVEVFHVREIFFFERCA